MANASELLHFLKSDRHICAFSLDGQDLLAEAVQIAFRNASVCLTGELLQAMPPVLQPPIERANGHDSPDDEAATAQVIWNFCFIFVFLKDILYDSHLSVQLFLHSSRFLCNFYRIF